MGVSTKDSEPILVMYEKSASQQPKLVIRPYTQPPTYICIIELFFFYLLPLIFMIYTTYFTCKILKFEEWSESRGWGMHEGWILLYEAIFGFTTIIGCLAGRESCQKIDTEGDYDKVYADNIQKLQRNFNIGVRHKWFQNIVDLPQYYMNEQQQNVWKEQMRIDKRIQYAAWLGGTWRTQELASTFSHTTSMFWTMVDMWASCLLIMFGFGIITGYESFRKYEYIYGTWLFIAIRTIILFLWSILLFRFGLQHGWKGGMVLEASSIRELCIEQNRKHGRDGKELLCRWIEDFLIPADSDDEFKRGMEKVVAAILKDVYWVEVRPWVYHGVFLPSSIDRGRRLVEKISTSTSDVTDSPKRRANSSAW